MEHSCCSLCKSLVASVRNSNEFKQKGDLLTLVSEKYRAFLALGMDSSRAYAMSLGLFLPALTLLSSVLDFIIRLYFPFTEGK